jgi:hypothetical protein
MAMASYNQFKNNTLRWVKMNTITLLLFSPEGPVLLWCRLLGYSDQGRIQGARPPKIGKNMIFLA